METVSIIVLDLPEPVVERAGILAKQIIASSEEIGMLEKEAAQAFVEKRSRFFKAAESNRGIERASFKRRTMFRRMPRQAMARKVIAP